MGNRVYNQLTAKLGPQLSYKNSIDFGNLTSQAYRDRINVYSCTYSYTLNSVLQQYICLSPRRKLLSLCMLPKHIYVCQLESFSHPSRSLSILLKSPVQIEAVRQYWQTDFIRHIISDQLGIAGQSIMLRIILSSETASYFSKKD